MVKIFFKIYNNINTIRFTFISSLCHKKDTLFDMVKIFCKIYDNIISLCFKFISSLMPQDIYSLWYCPNFLQDSKQHRLILLQIYFKPKPQDIYALWYGSNLLQDKLQHHHFSFQSHFKAQAARYILTLIWSKFSTRWIRTSSSYVSKFISSLMPQDINSIWYGPNFLPDSKQHRLILFQIYFKP